MDKQKIDDRYYIINYEHEVMCLRRLGWVCSCKDWMFNRNFGEKGYCKHIKEVVNDGVTITDGLIR